MARTSNLVALYDRAVSRAYDAAQKINRYAVSATHRREQFVNTNNTADALALAERLESIVNDFGLDQEVADEQVHHRSQG